MPTRFPRTSAAASALIVLAGLLGPAAERAAAQSPPSQKTPSQKTPSPEVSGPEVSGPKDSGPKAPSGKEQEVRWLPLFDGKSLTGWKVTQFGGQGEVTVEKGQMVLEMGSPMSGVTYTGEFPKQDFEIRLEAQRVEGTDFFCGLTFPVRDSHASLIVGGWAGSVVGISNIDDHDASDNDTTQVIKFDKGKWYKIRVRVTAARIQTWLDDKQIIDQDIKDRRISTRPEVDLSKPLGLSTYSTTAAVRNFEYRKL